MPRWPSGVRRRSASTRRCWPSCSAPPSCASCSTPMRSPTSSARSPGSPTIGARTASTRCTTCCAPSATSRSDEAIARGATAAGPRRARGVAPRHPGAHRRRAALAGDRGRRPGARRARRGPAGRRAGSVHRAGQGSARRSGLALRPHARAVPPVRRRGPARPRRRRRRRGPGPAGDHRPDRPGRVPARAAPRSSGATPRSCAWCAAARWRRCARRSSRCRRWRWPGSRRPGKASARGRRAASTAVLRAVEQLAGVPMPASALESLVLPSRVADYQPDHARRAHLERRGGVDRRRLRWPATTAGSCSPRPRSPRCCLPPPDPVDGERPAPCSRSLEPGSAVFFRALADRLPERHRRRRRRGRLGAGLGRRADQRHARAGARPARFRLAHRARPQAARAAHPVRPLRRSGRRADGRRTPSRPAHDGAAAGR